ncbi:hypothetical protein BGZ94_003383, partial [Podila epigama]
SIHKPRRMAKAEDDPFRQWMSGFGSGLEHLWDALQHDYDSKTRQSVRSLALSCLILQTLLTTIAYFIPQLVCESLSQLFYPTILLFRYLHPEPWDHLFMTTVHSLGCADRSDIVAKPAPRYFDQLRQYIIRTVKASVAIALVHSVVYRTGMFAWPGMKLGLIAVYQFLKYKRVKRPFLKLCVTVMIVGPWWPIKAVQVFTLQQLFMYELLQPYLARRQFKGWEERAWLAQHEIELQGFACGAWLLCSIPFVGVAALPFMFPAVAYLLTRSCGLMENSGNGLSGDVIEKRWPGVKAVALGSSKAVDGPWEANKIVTLVRYSAPTTISPSSITHNDKATAEHYTKEQGHRFQVTAAQIEFEKKKSRDRKKELYREAETRSMHHPHHHHILHHHHHHPPPPPPPPPPHLESEQQHLPTPPPPLPHHQHEQHPTPPERSAIIPVPPAVPTMPDWMFPMRGGFPFTHPGSESPSTLGSTASIPTIPGVPMPPMPPTIPTMPPWMFRMRSGFPFTHPDDGGPSYSSGSSIPAPLTQAATAPAAMVTRDERKEPEGLDQPTIDVLSSHNFSDRKSIATAPSAPPAPSSSVDEEELSWAERANRHVGSDGAFRMESLSNGSDATFSSGEHMRDEHRPSLQPGAQPSSSRQSDGVLGSQKVKVPAQEIAVRAQERAVRATDQRMHAEENRLRSEEQKHRARAHRVQADETVDSRHERGGRRVSRPEVDQNHGRVRSHEDYYEEENERREDEEGEENDMEKDEYEEEYENWDTRPETWQEQIHNWHGPRGGGQIRGWGRGGRARPCPPGRGRGWRGMRGNGHGSRGANGWSDETLQSHLGGTRRAENDVIGLPSTFQDRLSAVIAENMLNVEEHINQRIENWGREWAKKLNGNSS